MRNLTICQSRELIHAQDDFGFTAIHVACMNTHDEGPEIAQLLLQVDPLAARHKDNLGQLPLHIGRSLLSNPLFGRPSSLMTRPPAPQPAATPGPSLSAASRSRTARAARAPAPPGSSSPCSAPSLRSAQAAAPRPKSPCHRRAPPPRRSLGARPPAASDAGEAAFGPRGGWFDRRARPPETLQTARGSPKRHSADLSTSHGV